MASFDDPLQQAEDLVNQYLKLQQQKDLLEEKILLLKQKIASFSKKSNMKTLKSANTLLYVFFKSKTMFPKKGEPGRKKIEEIMRKSGEWKHAITFDIVKLGYAYEKKRLSKNLMEKLEPFIHKEEVAKIYTRNITESKRSKNEEKA